MFTVIISLYIIVNINHVFLILSSGYLYVHCYLPDCSFVLLRCTLHSPSSLILPWHLTVHCTLTCILFFTVEFLLYTITSLSCTFSLNPCVLLLPCEFWFYSFNIHCHLDDCSMFPIVVCTLPFIEVYIAYVLMYIPCSHLLYIYIMHLFSCTFECHLSYMVQ